MAAKSFEQSWRAAWAAKLSDWRIMGLVSGPRVADPAIEGEDWCAWARGPTDERADGYGPSPQDALSTLANRLRDVKG